MQTRLTLLNDMIARDFDGSLDWQREHGIVDLDLRMDIYGHSINNLPAADAERAAAAIAERNMRVHAFATGLLVGEISAGIDEARSSVDRILASALETANILTPRFVRILAGQWVDRPAAPGAVSALRSEYPWVIDEYRRVADRIAEAGFVPIIENEATNCFLSDPREFREFMELVDHPTLRLTWDVQNQWATGTYPEASDLDLLEPWVSYVHLKGARSVEGRPSIAGWNCSLEDSDYPVVEIATAVVNRGSSEVICLNPTQHGRDIPGYDYSTVSERDLEYLRRSVPGLV